MNVAHRSRNTTYARKRIRSTIAPEMSAGVMIANISWNMACACSGIVAAYAGPGSNPTPGHPSPPRPRAGGLYVFERLPLDRGGVDCRERRVVHLARADADDALDRLHEDLAVADLAGAGGRQDGVDARLHERLGARHFDLHFFVEFHDDRGAAVLLDDLLLAPVAADAGQRDPGDAGPAQRCLDLGEALGPYDGGDEFHRAKLTPPVRRCQSIFACSARFRRQ